MSLMLSCTSALVEDEVIPPPEDEVLFTMVAGPILGDGAIIFPSFGFSRNVAGSINPDDTVDGARIETVGGALGKDVDNSSVWLLALPANTPELGSWEIFEMTGVFAGGPGSITGSVTPANTFAYVASNPNFGQGYSVATWSMFTVAGNSLVPVNGNSYACKITW